MLNEIVDQNILNEYKYKQFDDNLIVIYDFISHNEQNILLNIINNVNDRWMYNDDKYSELAVINDKPITQVLTKRFNHILQNKNLYPSEFSTVFKFKKGDQLTEHIDYGPHIDNMIYSSVLYLNDDFTGGELYFTKKNIEIKPVARSIAIFMSDQHHLVKPVTSENYRYCLPNFSYKDYNKLVEIARNN